MLKLALDALGSAGGSRRVLQQVAFDFVVDGRIGFIGNAFGVAVPTVEVVVGDDQQRGSPLGSSASRPSSVFRSAAEPMIALALLLSMM